MIKLFEIYLIQKELKMEEFNRLFRKAAFGGFNKEDVINYIEKTKNDFFEYKQQSENHSGAQRQN